MNEDQRVSVQRNENNTRGWHSRGYLPHRDELNVLQSITFRLADSLPHEKIRHMEAELALQPEDRRERERQKQIEHWLDAVLGCCALRNPEVATVVENALKHSDGERYHLRAWCIMPNHVHTLIHPLVPMAGIVQSWKSFTGRWALGRNAELQLGISGGRFWMREYWDRYIRDQAHLFRVETYIHQNPVKAGLCCEPNQWPWSSARHRDPKTGTLSSSSA